MSEMKIDLETGLPELEEGFRWEVKKGPEYLTVHLTEERETKSKGWKRVFGPKTEWVSIDLMDVCDKKFVEDGSRLRHPHEASLIRQGYTLHYNIDSWGDTVDVEYIRLVEQSPENVLNAATKVYERHVERMETRRKLSDLGTQMDKLAGVYPPKKLVL